MAAGMRGSTELLPPISLDDEGGGLLAGVVLDGAEGVQGLEVADLFDSDGGCADATHADDPGVVGKFIGGEDGDGAVLLDGLAGAELADVRVATAAGAEDAGAGGY